MTRSRSLTIAAVAATAVVGVVAAGAVAASADGSPAALQRGGAPTTAATASASPAPTASALHFTAPKGVYPGPVTFSLAKVPPGWYAASFDVSALAEPPGVVFACSLFRTGDKLAPVSAVGAVLALNGTASASGSLHVAAGDRLRMSCASTDPGFRLTFGPRFGVASATLVPLARVDVRAMHLVPPAR